MTDSGTKRKSVAEDDYSDDHYNDEDERTEEESDEELDVENSTASLPLKPGPASSKTESRGKRFGNQSEPLRNRPGPACSKRSSLGANANNHSVSPHPIPEKTSSISRGSEENSNHQPISSTPQPGTAYPLRSLSVGRKAAKNQPDQASQNSRNGSEGTYSPLDIWEDEAETEGIFSSGSLTQRTLPWRIESPRKSSLLPQQQTKQSSRSPIKESKLEPKITREEIITLVRQFPNVWNRGKPALGNREKRMEAWKAISQKLNIPVLNCQKKWKSIREQYCRDKKRLADEGHVTDKTMQFLNDMNFFPRRKRAGVQKKKLPGKASSRPDTKSSVRVKTVIRRGSPRLDQAFADGIAQELQRYLPRQQLEIKAKIYQVLAEYSKNA